MPSPAGGEGAITATPAVLTQ